MNGHTCNGTNGVVNKTRNDDTATQFLHRIANLLIEKSFRASTNTKATKVVDFLQPEELREKFDFEIGRKGVDDDTLVKYCEDTIKYSVKTGHPYFFNQLFQGQDEHGLAGTWLVEAVNTSAYTYEVAPVFVLMEHQVLSKMRQLMGYKTGDGIFCPGGSISNMYGMNLARYKMFPEIKAEGNWVAPRLCFFASEQSHYSLKKGAGFMGIGVNNLIFVKTNDKGQMDVRDLQAKILTARAEGRHPFMVVATSGTTVLGAFDPLDAIADVCVQHELWMHVDCCWGGSVQLSNKHKHLMKGIERSDSLAWNPHKMMGSPLQCCAFLTRHENILQECHSANATYLFQQDKNYDVSYDTGDKSLQCGRKVDVFKLWLMWKAKGDVGFERDIDNIMDRAQYIMQKMKDHPGFRIVLDPIECTNVCFWYIPPSMRGQEETDKWWEKLSTVAPKIKERMMEEGTMLIGYQPLGKRVNFFRLVISNLQSTNANMDFVVNQIDRLGKDL